MKRLLFVSTGFSPDFGYIWFKHQTRFLCKFNAAYVHGACDAIYVSTAVFLLHIKGMK